MHTGLRLLAPLLASSLLITGGTRAQTGADILNRMLAEYEKRTEHVDNYTLIQETLGQETVAYFEKDVVDGRPVFRVRSAGLVGAPVPSEDQDEGGWDDLYTTAPDLAARAEYSGRDNIQNHSVHVVTVNDLHEIGFGTDASMGDTDFEPTRGTFYVDAETWVVRRLVFEGEMTYEGEPHDVTSTIEFQEYREVDGMLHPFLISVRTEGLGEAMGPEMREQYEEMKKELEQMPEAQRQMVERMMKEQMEAMEGMANQPGGGMTVEIRVKELRVNSGPPAGR